ncbi:MAG: G5 domain-containing protein [Bacillota bacterium]|nr:G5 domain-containing protein [Bacillota bacterium]
MVRTIPEAGGPGGRAAARPAARTRRSSAPKWQARLVAFLAVLILLSASLAWALTRKEIQLVVDGQTRRVVTHRRLVRALLRAHGIRLGPADEVVPGPASPLKRRMRVAVYRAVPITVQVDGRTFELLTPKQTVREALVAAGVALGEHDRVEPSATAPVASGLTVVVHRVEIKDVQQQVEIPFTVLRRQDPELEKGLERVIRAGVKGLKERTIRVTTEDGKVIAKALVAEKVLREPQPQLVAVGTKKVVRTLRTSRGEYRYTERRVMVATAYDPSPRSIGPKATGYTYLGLKAQYGIVAVDPRVIPLRSRLYIPGYGEALAADIGGAIKGNRIDLCFDTYEEAIRFGRRKVEVYVLE